MPRHHWVKHASKRWQTVRKQKKEKQKKEKGKTNFLKNFASGNTATAVLHGKQEDIRKADMSE